MGESLLGIKWRFYEHHPGDASFSNCLGTGLRGVFTRHLDQQLQTTEQTASASGDSPGAIDAPEKAVNVSVSTYPQLYVNNPTRSVARGVIAAGTSFFLPLEVNGRIGPIRLDGEVGYNFGNHSVPESWARGLLVGHEFSDTTEAYMELYDQQDADRIPMGQGFGQFATGYPKQRETTLGLGGRQAVNRAKTRNLLLMGGRSFLAISTNNAQPSWIAYVGLQVLLAPK